MLAIRQSLVMAALALVLTACQTASEHRAAVRDDSGDRVTVGKVQREIRVGMTNAEVVEARREVWVYDKISTERVYSTSSGGVSALILGGALVGAGLVGGAGGGSYDASSGAESTSQRTLTIVIKYDEQSRVRDFAYRSSSF